MSEVTKKRGRGRPKGAKNKPKPAESVKAKVRPGPDKESKVKSVDQIAIDALIKIGEQNSVEARWANAALRKIMREVIR